MAGKKLGSVWRYLVHVMSSRLVEIAVLSLSKLYIRLIHVLAVRGLVDSYHIEPLDCTRKARETGLEMRRSHTVKHMGRPSLALGPDDLGVLREGDETNEDVLRKQLLERDRECERVSFIFPVAYRSDLRSDVAVAERELGAEAGTQAETRRG